jgi:phytanoyl-CoA hydroxylase
MVQRNAQPTPASELRAQTSESAFANLSDADLSPAELQSFESEGLLRLGRVVTAEELAGLRERIDQIMLGEVRYPDMLMQLDSDSGRYEDAPEQTVGFKGATLSYRKIEQLEQDPRFLRYLQKPLFRAIAARFIGPEVAAFRSMFMNKPALQGTLLPWHQDGGEHWGLDRDPPITLWLALDDATRENGCVEVVPGSHRLGLLSARGHTISEEQAARYCSAGSVHLELLAGECVLLHNFLLHRSGRNHTARPRRAFSVCLMDAGTRLKRSPSVTFPKIFGAGSLTVNEAEGS